MCFFVRIVSTTSSDVHYIKLTFFDKTDNCQSDFFSVLQVGP